VYYGSGTVDRIAS